MVRPGSNPNTNEPAVPKQEAGIRTKEIRTERVDIYLHWAVWKEIVSKFKLHFKQKNKNQSLPEIKAETK